MPKKGAKKLARYCKKCGERYYPTGKFQKLCGDCNQTGKPNEWKKTKC